MEVSENLQCANEDLVELRGKKVELSREKNRLSNHKQVFLAELDRINSELESIDSQLNVINKEFDSTQWKIFHLRIRRCSQIFFQCLYYIYTCLTFIVINVLYILYLILKLAANVSRTLLDSQINSISGSKAPLDDSLSWT